MPRYQFVIAIFFSLILSACGGGGGASGSKYSINLSKASVAFVTSNGGIAAPQQVTAAYKGDGVIVGTLPGTNMPGWLQVSNGVQTANSATFTISVSSTGLSPGNYQFSLRFVTGKEDGTNLVYKDLNVTLKVADNPHANKDSLIFDSSQGEKIPNVQPLRVTTIDQNLGWTLTTSVPWLTLSSASGSGSKDLSITAVNTGLTPGVYTAKLTLKDINQFSSEIAVTLNVQPRVVYANKRGIALVNTTNIQKLEDDILMVDAVDLENPNWVAVSNQPWLSVTSNSKAKIHIAANPQGLSEGMHYAKVDITSTVDDIVSSESVNVGFYITSGSSVEGNLATINSNWDFNAFNLAMAVDPIRPYFYVADALTGLLNKINVHTGVLEAPLPMVSGENFSALTVSSDGDTLYAFSSSHPKIYKLNLLTLTWSSVPISSNFGNPSRIMEMHPNGKAVLLIHEAEIIIDIDTGNTLSDFTSILSFGGDGFAISGDQKTLYSVNFGVSGGGLGISRFELKNNLISKTMMIKANGFVDADISNTQDIATNADGSQINIASGGHYSFPTYTYDAINGLKYLEDLQGAAYPTAVEIGENGILYAGMSVYYNDDTVYAYAKNGELKYTYSIGQYRSLLNGQKGMQISGDGTRLLLVSTESLSGPKTTLWGFATVNP